MVKDTDKQPQRDNHSEKTGEGHDNLVPPRCHELTDCIVIINSRKIGNIGMYDVIIVTCVQYNNMESQCVPCGPGCIQLYL